MDSKRSLFVSVFLAAALFLNSAPAWASSEVDALLNKLVDKGVLTVSEAQEVRNDMAADSKAIASAQEADVKDIVSKMPGGSWLKTVKWGGDLRLRYEGQWREPSVDRQRERFRLRFGFTAQPIEPLKIGVRLASGASGDPLSTNQSFTSTFDKKAIFIDQAYAKYTPWQWITLTGGKMEIPYDYTDLVLDSDITMEGAAVQLKSPRAIPVINEVLPIVPWLNMGAYQLAELSGDEGDPALFGFQTGANIDLPMGISLVPSIAYYDFTGIKGLNTSNLGFASLPGGNTTVAKGSANYYSYDYGLIDAIVRLTVPDVFGQQVALIGDYVRNTNAPDDNTAWQAGTEVGKVTEKFGSWKAYYFYKMLERDAVFAGLTDSDFGGGGTNHFGHIFGVQMGLNKYATVGLKYFRTDEVEGTQAKNDTLQADLQMKF